MRDPENIQDIFPAEPDYLGYIFHPSSKRYVGKEPDPEIFDKVPSTTKKVAVFVNEELEKVLDICKEHQIEVAQLHGNESPEYCQKVRERGLLVFKVFSVGEQFDFSILGNYTNVVDFFLFDTKGKLPGGTGMKFNWEILQNYKLNVPFFLSGGVGLEDAEAILEFKHEQLFAIDINSGFELEPALKNVQKVHDFMSQISIKKQTINMKYQVDKKGYYGEFGGAYIPEMMHPNIEELQQKYMEIINSYNFRQDFIHLLKHYVGRPSPLYRPNACRKSMAPIFT